MITIEYLNKYGLDKLVEEFSIKVSVDERFPDLLVLNYNQIDSPKDHPIVKECRSLVVGWDGDSFHVVSRAFDRFFNQGECATTYDLSEVTLYEKIDGSLVSVFYTDQYGWLYRTKSMIMPELSVQGWERTWKDFIESALDWEIVNKSLLDKDYTYIFEVVGRENRVVVKYPEDEAYLLAVRNNLTGEYTDVLDTIFNTPRKYSFNTTQDCMNSLQHLPNLEEGYVGYQNGVPVVKIKSPQYLSAHRLRGEGLTPKRIMEMVVIGECDEYFAVFPEDKVHFEKYTTAWKNLENSLSATFNLYQHITDRKEFALKVKDFPFSAILFQSQNTSKNVIKVLHDQKVSYKIKLLSNLIGEN